MENQIFIFARLGRCWETKKRGSEKKLSEDVSVKELDEDLTEQLCLIGVGPHQVDRRPPSRVRKVLVGPAGGEGVYEGPKTVPMKRTMQAGCSFVCEYCCSLGRKYEPPSLSPLSIPPSPFRLPSSRCLSSFSYFLLSLFFCPAPFLCPLY